MGGHHTDVAGHVRSYMKVFGALAVFTGITVGASYIHFGSHAVNIIVALVIAAIKASLVAAIFMHLKWERGMSIWWTLLICGIFFAVLMSLPSLTANDDPPQVQHSTWDVPVPAAGKPQGSSGGH